MNSISSSIPFMTRIYITASICLMILCSLDIISPLSLYMSWTMILQGEVWRLITSFVYFGSFGMTFFWNVYALVHYCSSLESMTMHDRPADFLWMLIFSAGMLLTLSQFFRHNVFYGGSMINILTYIWSRKNPHNFVGVIFINVPAPYFPWVMLALSHLTGYAITDNVLGIVVGHTYYFFTDVFPTLPLTRGCRPLDTPLILKALLNQR